MQLKTKKVNSLLGIGTFLLVTGLGAQGMGHGNSGGSGMGYGNSGSSGMGHQGQVCDSLTTISVQGVAIVVQDTAYLHEQYYLDEDGDGSAEYRLGFGATWYEPGSGAVRPQDGDTVQITGLLRTFIDMDMIVVLEINGLFWRDPGPMNGGSWGNHGNQKAFRIDSQVIIEGTVLVDTLGQYDHIYLDVDQDDIPDYFLHFGPRNYVPASGAQLPLNGDYVLIVGGLMTEPDPDWVIVYELNGETWRDPESIHGHGSREIVDRDKRLMGVYNYPNPFNPVTTIEFTLYEQSRISVQIFDLQGRLIKTLVNGNRNSGSHSVVWNGRDNYGNPVASGVYYYRVSDGLQSVARQLMLLK